MHSRRSLLLVIAFALLACGGSQTAPLPPPSTACAPAPSASTAPVASVPAPSAPPDDDAIAAAVAAANGKPGIRHLPARDIPVPTVGVSPQMQKIIGAPYDPFEAVHPKTAAEWKALVAKFSEGAAAQVKDLAAKLGVDIEPRTIAGVACYELTPKTVPARNRNRRLMHVHGGAYVFGGGPSAAAEGVLLTGIGGFRVVSVDYRMPPDFPYPAAVDDAIAVWKELVKTTPPRNMGIFGLSAGGGLTLATVLRAKGEHAPLPGAMAPGTPWADLTHTGDSYRANEWLDSQLQTWPGLLADTAKLYAGNHDPADPLISPLFGDYHGLPPTILTTGTRDLFLSDTVNVHRRLKRAGVEAQLEVYEGESHGMYAAGPDVPETREAFGDMAAFFDAHLGR